MGFLEVVEGLQERELVQEQGAGPWEDKRKLDHSLESMENGLGIVPCSGKDNQGNTQLELDQGGDLDGMGHTVVGLVQGQNKD